MKKWILIILALVLLIPIAILFLRKDNVVSREEAIAQCASPDSKYYDWNDLEIHYTDQGVHDTTILMIHGFGGSHKNFAVIADILEDHFRVVCIDVPAFGLSEVPSNDIADENMFALYQEFIRNSVSALDINYYHLMGNSMGGWIAWDFAAENDSMLLSLTLLNSAGFGMKRVKETATGWMTGPFGQLVFKKGVPFRISKSNAKRVFYDDEKVNLDRAKANYYMLNKEGTFPWMLRMAANPIYPDTSKIELISCPALILWGKNDEVIPVAHADNFASQISRSEKIIYDNCGHTPQMEFPERVAEDWLNFIAKTEER